MELNMMNYSQNYLIQGDNSISLRILNEHYNGKIDVIYIDPPYNTGSSNFKYKDRMPHAEWRNFMMDRLIIAKELLTQDGVIFISIDDNELYNLKLLCDEVFGEENFIVNFIWRKTGQQQNNGRNVSIVTEYILCYAKQLYQNGKKKSLFRKDNIANRKGKAAYSHFDKEVGKYYRLNPIQDRSLGKHEYTLYHPETKKSVHSKNWRITREKYEELLGQGLIHWTKNLPNIKKYMADENTVLVNNIIEGIYNEQGNEDLAKILGKNTFTNPKPVKLIKYLVGLYNKNDICVLDFFAGSGTTGQAIMEMNEDGNKRNFILCTNNENNICQEVTYRRLKSLIKNTYRNTTFVFCYDDTQEEVGASL